MTDLVYLRDIDGTGSMHVCASGDVGAVPYVPEAATTIAAQAAELQRLREALGRNADEWANLIDLEYVPSQNEAVYVALVEEARNLTGAS